MYKINPHDVFDIILIYESADFDGILNYLSKIDSTLIVDYIDEDDEDDWDDY